MYAGCPVCDYVWPAVLLPMSVNRVIEALDNLRCPSCGACDGGGTEFFAADPPHTGRIMEWSVPPDQTNAWSWTLHLEDEQGKDETPQVKDETPMGVFGMPPEAPHGIVDGEITLVGIRFRILSSDHFSERSPERYMAVFVSEAHSDIGRVTAQNGEVITKCELCGESNRRWIGTKGRITIGHYTLDDTENVGKDWNPKSVVRVLHLERSAFWLNEHMRQEHGYGDVSDDELASTGSLWGDKQ